MVAVPTSAGASAREASVAAKERPHAGAPAAACSTSCRQYGSSHATGGGPAQGAMTHRAFGELVHGRATCALTQSVDLFASAPLPPAAAMSSPNPATVSPSGATPLSAASSNRESASASEISSRASPAPASKRAAESAVHRSFTDTTDMALVEVVKNTRGKLRSPTTVLYHQCCKVTSLTSFGLIRKITTCGQQKRWLYLMGEYSEQRMQPSTARAELEQGSLDIFHVSVHC